LSSHLTWQRLLTWAAQKASVVPSVESEAARATQREAETVELQIDAADYCLFSAD
jgi:type IV secretory pathway VirD2 relaxase